MSRSRQSEHLRRAGAAIKRQGATNVGGVQLRAAVAHENIVHALAAIDARSRQLEAERAGQRRLGPAGVGRAMLSRVAPHRGARPRAIPRAA